MIGRDDQRYVSGGMIEKPAYDDGLTRRVGEKERVIM